jgi:hypothetical protein
MCKGAAVSDCVSLFFAHALEIGEELEAFLGRHSAYDRIIYVGDGTNDFCPVLRLRRLKLF